MLGFGTYELGGHEAAKQAVLRAIKAGYRLFDTAPLYQTDRAVGEAIRESGIPREEFFISSKLWITYTSYDKAREWVDMTLQAMDLAYFDMLLIHNPQNDVHGAWRAMEEMYEEGKVRAIGLSNFHADRVMDIMLYNKVKPALVQLETHVFNQRKEEYDFLKNNDIVHEAWAPLVQGERGIFQNKVLKSIADNHQKTIAQVALRFLFQRGIMTVPRAVNPDFIKENISIFDFELSNDDMAAIKALDEDKTTFFDNRDPELLEIFGQLM